jgi:hypothetical protein
MFSALSFISSGTPASLFVPTFELFYAQASVFGFTCKSITLIVVCKYIFTV